MEDGREAPWVGGLRVRLRTTTQRTPWPPTLPHPRKRHGHAHHQPTFSACGPPSTLSPSSTSTAVDHGLNFGQLHCSRPTTRCWREIRRQLGAARLTDVIVPLPLKSSTLKNYHHPSTFIACWGCDSQTSPPHSSASLAPLDM